MNDWSFAWHDAVGFLGVVCLIGAYAGLQAGRLSADRPLYSALNALAALLITVSLIYSFNAASFVIEVFWFAISIYGLVRSLRRKRDTKPAHQDGAPPLP